MMMGGSKMSKVYIVSQILGIILASFDTYEGSFKRVDVLLDRRPPLKLAFLGYFHPFPLW